MKPGENHPENNVAADFWPSRSNLSFPARFVAWQACGKEMMADPRIRSAYHALAEHDPRPEIKTRRRIRSRRSELIRNEDLGDYVGEAYDPNEPQPGKYNWRRVTAIGALGAMFVGMTGMWAVVETKQREQEQAQHRAVVAAALRDVDTLGALGVCSVELRTEASYLNTVNNKAITRGMPPSEDYYKAASLAGDWNLSCDSQVREVSATIDKDYRAKERLTADDIVSFNLSDACKDAKAYGDNPNSYSYDLSRAMANAAMAYDAGIKC